MTILFSNEMADLFEKRNYKTYATELCVAALIIYKLFKAI